MKNWNAIAAGLIVLMVPMFMAAEGDGCAAALSESDAPDVSGVWDIVYDDKLDVTVTIGGATYTAELGPQGGSFTIEHDGNPFEFNLDCSRPEVVCPSEVWPQAVSITHKNPTYQHQMHVMLPTLTCDGTMKKADPATCGEGTDNPECKDICDGTLSVKEQEVFGVIGETGETFRVFLGASIATNGVNCALLGTSVADAELVTTSRRTTAWAATAIENGTIETVYSGACLWADDVTGDGNLEALVLGAQIKFQTGFTGTPTRR